MTCAHQHKSNTLTPYRVADSTVGKSNLDSASSMDFANLAPPSKPNSGKIAATHGSLQHDAVASKGKFLVGLVSDISVKQPTIMLYIYIYIYIICSFMQVLEV